MTKELIASLVAMVALLGTLAGVTYSYGQLTERVEASRVQIAVLTSKVEALSLDLNGTRLEIMRLLTSRNR